MKQVFDAKTGPQREDLLSFFFFCRAIFCASRVFALCKVAFRRALKPLPARLMKYVSILMPDDGPLGETRLDARARAMLAALLVKSPLGGCVESVRTLATHRFVARCGIATFLGPALRTVVFESQMRLSFHGFSCLGFGPLG
jgi:hypothetical protein